MDLIETLTRLKSDLEQGSAVLTDLENPEYVAAITEAIDRLQNTQQVIIPGIGGGCGRPSANLEPDSSFVAPPLRDDVKYVVWGGGGGGGNIDAQGGHGGHAKSSCHSHDHHVWTTSENPSLKGCEVCSKCGLFKATIER